MKKVLVIEDNRDVREDIADILAYTAQEKAAPPASAGGANAQAAAQSEGGISNELILGALAILFALLALMIALKYFHKRPFKNIITPKSEIDYRKIFFVKSRKVILLAI